MTIAAGWGASPKFEIVSSAPVALAVAPSLALRTRVTVEPGTLVHAIVLSARIRVDAARRTYTNEEKERLRELFGTAEQWNTTVRVPLSWAEVSVSVGRFEGGKTFDLVVPCSYDLALATTKLFDALEDGPIPLTLAFSGTVFAEREHARERSLTIVPLGSQCEARCEVPSATWRELMAAHHPTGALVPVDHAVVERLRRAAPGATLSRAIERLLDRAEPATNVRRREPTRETEAE